MRREVTVTITEDNRDRGRTFILTEMPARQAEEWALRAFLALTKSGVEIPEEIADAGLAGLASIGLKALGQVEYSEAKLLFDEMFKCVEFVPDPNTPAVRHRQLDEVIEEVSTRLKLRMELWTLHTGFSLADVKSKQVSETTTSAVSSTVRIPRGASPSSSRAAKQR